MTPKTPISKILTGFGALALLGAPAFAGNAVMTAEKVATSAVDEAAVEALSSSRVAARLAVEAEARKAAGLGARVATGEATAAEVKQMQESLTNAFKTTQTPEILKLKQAAIGAAAVEQSGKSLAGVTLSALVNSGKNPSTLSGILNNDHIQMSRQNSAEHGIKLPGVGTGINTVDTAKVVEIALQKGKEVGMSPVELKAVEAGTKNLAKFGLIGSQYVKCFSKFQLKDSIKVILAGATNAVNAKTADAAETAMIRGEAGNYTGAYSKAQTCSKVGAGSIKGECEIYRSPNFDAKCPTGGAVASY